MHWAESMAGEKDVTTVVVSVDAKVAMWVVVMVAWMVVHLADVLVVSWVAEMAELTVET